MRLISVDQSSVTEDQPGGAIVVGTDDRTGDMVRFTVDLDEAATIRSGQTTMLEVEEDDVLSTFPTSGQWDSPGTSPEEEDS